MKTSDLFKRAKQLADLEGSDFISWNEAISCINESNVSLYEKLISMGDNSFVKSFRTKEEVEDLPEDFWQLKGVFLWNNGNLQTINRRADNNGVHHLSYEIRNGKLYLFAGLGWVPRICISNGFAGGSVIIFLPMQEMWFGPWVQKIPWSRKWQPTPVFLPSFPEEPSELQSTGS